MMISSGENINQALWARLDYGAIAKYILYAILLFSPLARGSVHGWQQGIIEIAALLILSCLLLARICNGVDFVASTDLDRPIAALLLLLLISLIFSLSKPESIESVMLVLAYLVFFYATVHICRTRENQRELVYAVCIIATLPVCIAYVKGFGADPGSFWVYDDVYYSPRFFSGVYGNHNHLAGYLEMVIPLMLSLFLTRKKRGWRRILLSCWALVFLVCHLLTLSRGGWFSLACSLVFMLVILKVYGTLKRKAMLVAASSLCCIFFVLVLSGTELFERVLSLTEGESMMSMDERLLIWRGTVNCIVDHMLMGTGPGTFSIIFPYYQLPGTLVRFYQAHNDYLQYVMELGIFFIPLCFWTLFTLFRSGFKKLSSRSRQVRGYSLATMAGIVAILLHSLVDFNLHIPANALLFTVLAALSVARLEKTKRK